MKITITKNDILKANRKGNRDAEIELGLIGRTRTIIYKNKKAYDRKRDKKVNILNY